MVITILVVTGFQVYWLFYNFDRERIVLKDRMRSGFTESIAKLQGAKFNLHKFFGDSTSNFNFDITSRENGPLRVRMAKPESVAGLVNTIGEKVGDSLRKFNKINSTIIVSSESKDFVIRNDTSAVNIEAPPGGPKEGFFRFLYRIDSLQDTLTVSAIDSAYSVFLKKEKIDVPFEIHRTDKDTSVMEWRQRGLPPFSEISREKNVAGSNDHIKMTIGLTHPVTYELKLGNTFPYLLKKITSPLLFSLFLIGLTVISLLFLYRNLLKQKKLAEIKNEFISNITHELKTPIATVGVAIEALRNFNAINDPERTKEYLDISQNELHRLSLLVDKVLKLSMFEKKEIELKPEPINMKHLVDEVVASMKLQVEKRNATVSISEKGDTGLQGDKLHLLSVVFNLLDNALKYGNGNIAVKFEIEGDETELKLSVSDNGIGIAPEYKDKVFEKFFRVPAGNTHNTKGYGLGLSYVAHVVEKHNGKIIVESQPELGTKFIITIPKQEL